VTAGTSIEMDAGGNITIDDSELTADETWIDLDADGDVTVTDGTIDAGTSVKVRAGGNLAATDSTVVAGTSIDLDADTGDITLTRTALTASLTIDGHAGGDIDLTDATATAGGNITLRAGGSLTALRSDITSLRGDIALTAVTGSVLLGDQVHVRAGSGADAPAATSRISAGRDVTAVESTTIVAAPATTVPLGPYGDPTGALTSPWRITISGDVGGTAPAPDRRSCSQVPCAPG
jgi:hypothetical protein